MSHDLEIRADGTASYVGAREDAWHKLGVTYYDRDGLTTAEALAGLDAGTIETIPVQGVRMTDDGVEIIEDPAHKMTVRVRPSGVVKLGIVGKDYTVISEADAFAFMDNMIDAGGARVSAAGLLNGGRRAFCTMRLDREILIGGRDAVEMFLVGGMGHDGSMSVTVAATGIRVVCRNTWDLMLANTTRLYKVRHTANAKLQVEQARQVLELTYAYVDAFTAEAEKLIAKTCTDKRFDAIIAELYGPAEDAGKAVVTAWETKRDTLWGLWNAETQAEIKNTAWGALQTLIEFDDWYRGVRGADDEDAARFERSLSDAMGRRDRKGELLKVVKFATR